MTMVCTASPLLPFPAGITGYPLSALRYLAEHSTVPIHTCISYCRYNLHDRGLVEDGMLAFLEGKGIAGEEAT